MRQQSAANGIRRLAKQPESRQPSVPIGVASVRGIGGCGQSYFMKYLVDQGYLVLNHIADADGEKHRERGHAPCPWYARWKEEGCPSPHVEEEEGCPSEPTLFVFGHPWLSISSHLKRNHTTLPSSDVLGLAQSLNDYALETERCGAKALSPD